MSVKRTAVNDGISLSFEDYKTLCECVDMGGDDGVVNTGSREQELVASVPSRIRERHAETLESVMLESVKLGYPSTGDEEQARIEDWEAEEAGTGDDVSSVAQGSRRTEIDRRGNASAAAKEK
jgi:hypothetical protein